MSFPAVTPTSQPQASALLSNNAQNAGLTNTIPLDRLSNLEQVVGNLLTDTPAGVIALPVSETILVAGAVSITAGVTNLSAASGAYAVTLAAPTAAQLGMTKIIQMTVAGNAITMALTNVMGGTAASSASFDAVAETLTLVACASKWMVTGQAGVTLS